MKTLLKAFIMLQAIAAVLSGCAYAPTWVATGERVYQRSALEPYTIARNNIPSLPTGYTRIYIYRPQVFIGSLGSAVVIINGKWMGDVKRPFDNNLLRPGSVFIVDTPADVAQVWWYQSGKGEEKDKLLSLPSTENRTWYLKWNMKPTYGYLEIIPEQKAMNEIESLRFSGYVKLDHP